MKRNNKPTKRTSSQQPLSVVEDLGYCVRYRNGAEFLEVATDKEVLGFIGGRIEAQDRGPMEIGDAAIFLQGRHGEKYEKLLGRLCETYSDRDGWYAYIRTCKWVASSVHLSDRSDKLGFRHHYEVAKLGRADQRRFLKLAEDNEWSVSELRLAIRAEQAEIPKLEWKPDFNPVAWADEGLRWFRRQFEAAPIETWDPERRALLKRDLQPIAELYAKL